MSDRTEALLAELVELTKHQIAHQEEALAGQRQAIAMQTEAVKRQRSALVVLFVLFGVVFLFAVGAPLVSFFTFFTRR